MKKIAIFGLGAVVYAISSPLAQAQIVIQPTIELGQPVVEPAPYYVAPTQIVVDHPARHNFHHRYDWGYWNHRPAPAPHDDRDHRR